MMNFRMFGYAMLAVGMLAATDASATELKVGFVDVKSAIENTQQYRDGMQHLEKIKNTKQKELETLRDEINQMDKDLLNQSMAMSPDQLTQKQQEINDKKKGFQRKLQDAQEAMTMERNHLLQGINLKFGKQVKALGKEKKFDYILTRPSVLYVNEAHDITADVTKLLDSGK